MAELLSDSDAFELQNISARCTALQDLSSLLELQLIGKEGSLQCLMALEGLLRQASALMRHMATGFSLSLQLLHVRQLVISMVVLAPGDCAQGPAYQPRRHQFRQARAEPEALAGL